jgi:antitoxin MazE
MQTTVVKWGNSQGIRLPKAFLQNIRIAENDPVEVTLQENTIIITKSKAHKHKTVKERLIEFYGTEYAQKPIPQTEINWGSPAGKEIW